MFGYITGLVLIILFFYRVWNWLFKFDFWTSRGIPGPRPWPLLGTSYQMFFKPTPLVEVEWLKKFGKIYGIYNGASPALTVADPVLIKQILVKDFHLFRNRRPNPSTHPVFSNVLTNARNDDWKRIRAISSPTFSSGKIKKMSTLINGCVEELINNLEECSKNQQTDLKRLFGAFTMDVISKSFFATDINTFKNPDNPFVRNANAVFRNQWRFLLFFVAPVLKKIPFFSRLLTGFSSDGQFFIEVGRHLLAKRRGDSKKHDDFFQLLMDAEKTSESVEEVESLESHHINEGRDEILANESALKNVVEKSLTENEILAQCFIFFIAGYETTATTLSFCAYQLALNPTVQDQLFQELTEAFGLDNITDLDRLSQLPLLDAVIAETLRLYPQTPRLSREAAEDCRIGGVDVPKGMLVEIPVFAVHHSADLFDSPDRFEPRRFLPEQRHQLVSYSYLPFGTGPRNCVGMRFALFEMKLALAHVVRRFRFVRCENTDQPPEFVRGTRFLDAKRLLVKVNARIG